MGGHPCSAHGLWLGCIGRIPSPRISFIDVQKVASVFAIDPSAYIVGKALFPASLYRSVVSLVPCLAMTPWGWGI